jgi:hypothetical protein
VSKLVPNLSFWTAEFMLIPLYQAILKGNCCHQYTGLKELPGRTRKSGEKIILCELKFKICTRGLVRRQDGSGGL